MPTLKAWLEWREQCAFALCKTQTHAEMSGFITPIIVEQVRKRDRNLLPLADGGHSGLPNQACHLFETYMHATSGKTGKRWKDWLFGKADEAGASEEGKLAALECQAANACMSGARDHARQEGWYHRNPKLSRKKDDLDRPATGDPDGPTLGDLLPDPSSFGLDPSGEAAANEMEMIAVREAEGYFATLPPRSKVVLWARVTEQPLSAEEVLRFAGCRKSTLCKHEEQTPLLASLKIVASSLEAKYGPENPPEDVRELIARVIHRLGRLCLEEFSSGKKGEQLTLLK